MSKLARSSWLGGVLILSTSCVMESTPDAPPVALGTQEQGFRTGWHGAGHGEITDAALGFVREGTREDLADANEDTDGPLVCEGNRGLKDCGPTKLDSAYHVDNCRVGDAFRSLRRRYDDLVEALAPDQPDFDRAKKLFGTILHTSQDFYAHSNWVDAGQTALVGARGFYHPDLQPGAMLGNLVVLAEPLPPNFRVERDADSRVPRVWDGERWQLGFISGVYEDNEDSSLCPPEASIEHGDVNVRRWKDAGEYLAKDDPDSHNHAQAVDIAIAQSTEEFCRLVRLVTLRHGHAGREQLLDAWVEDRAGYDAFCPDDLALVAGMWMAVL